MGDNINLLELNNIENIPGIFEGFEVVSEKTDNIAWNTTKQKTINISWTSDRNGYAILTKGCSIYAGYYSEVSYSIKVNDEVIDNSSSYRIDVGNDVNNRTFLFPIKVGDVITATLTGNSGSSGGTLTLRLWASIVTPIDEGEGNNINKINVNNVEYFIGNSTIVPGTLDGFEVVTEKTDNLTWNGHKQGTVTISWISDRDGYAILTKGCSIFGKYYTENNYNITLNTESIDNNSSYRVDIGNDANNRVFLFPIKVGDVINASVTGNSGDSGGTLTLRLRASIVTPVGGEGEGNSINKINLDGVIYNLSGSSNTLATLTGVAGNVQETQAKEASDVSLSWTADEDCNVMILMMHSQTLASFTVYEASCNMGTVGELFMNSDANISSRASVFYLESGNTINARYRVFSDARNFTYIRIYKIK